MDLPTADHEKRLDTLVGGAIFQLKKHKLLAVTKDNIAEKIFQLYPYLTGENEVNLDGILIKPPEYKAAFVAAVMETLQDNLGKAVSLERASEAYWHVLGTGVKLSETGAKFFDTDLQKKIEELGYVPLETGVISDKIAQDAKPQIFYRREGPVQYVLKDVLALSTIEQIVSEKSPEPIITTKSAISAPESKIVDVSKGYIPKQEGGTVEEIVAQKGTGYTGAEKENQAVEPTKSLKDRIKAYLTRFSQLLWRTERSEPQPEKQTISEELTIAGAYQNGNDTRVVELGKKHPSNYSTLENLLIASSRLRLELEIKVSPTTKRERKKLWNELAIAARDYRQVKLNGTYNKQELAQIINSDINLLGYFNTKLAKYGMGQYKIRFKDEINAIKNAYASLLSK